MDDGKGGAVSEEELDAYGERLRSDTFKAYYTNGIHHEVDRTHVPIDDDEACDGCGECLEAFGAALTAYGEWERARGAAEQAATIRMCGFNSLVHCAARFGAGGMGCYEHEALAAAEAKLRVMMEAR